jgi:hypothetical protein
MLPFKRTDFASARHLIPELEDTAAAIVEKPHRALQIWH